MNALVAVFAAALASPVSAPRIATFSIVARDPTNGDLGVAVQLKFPNVPVAVPYAKAKEGFHTGRTDGVWDEASTKTLADYIGWENYDTRIRQDGKIDRKILELIKAKEGPM